MIKKVVVIIGSLLILINASHSAPQKSLWPFWNVYNENNTEVVSYQYYQDFLDHYLFKGGNGVNQLLYSKVNTKDRKEKNDIDDSTKKIFENSGFKPAEQELEQLPNNQRLVLMLHDIEQLSFNEICDMLEITQSNAFVLIHRARKTLYERIEQFLLTGRSS